MVQCGAKLRDGSGCTINASFPKDRPQTCRMPSHILQLFRATIASQGLQNDIPAYITKQVPPPMWLLHVGLAFMLSCFGPCCFVKLIAIFHSNSSLWLRHCAAIMPFPPLLLTSPSMWALRSILGVTLSLYMIKLGAELCLRWFDHLKSDWMSPGVVLVPIWCVPSS